MNSKTDTTEPTYRIGAVSRLTGISAETLRMWERRYGVVEPSRSGGRNRLYTREDIGRLALLKRLVDAGDAIGSIAHLSLDQLQERIQIHKAQGSLSPVEKDWESAHPRIAVLGDALPALVTQRGAELEGIEFVAIHRDRWRFQTELESLQPDIIIVEYPTVHQETAAEVNGMLARSGAQRALVVYGFGAQAAVRQLDTAQITPLRAPVGLPELRQAIFAGLSITAELPMELTTQLDLTAVGPLPSRRFPNETLAQIATLSTTVQCECPYHLVELIRSLVAFETYSSECKNSSPKDAALHAVLEATTARARAFMENALAHVVELEGLEVKVPFQNSQGNSTSSGT